jgi:hypothetical protein
MQSFQPAPGDEDLPDEVEAERHMDRERRRRWNELISLTERTAMRLSERRGPLTSLGLEPD